MKIISSAIQVADGKCILCHCCSKSEERRVSSAELYLHCTDSVCQMPEVLGELQSICLNEFAVSSGASI